MKQFKQNTGKSLISKLMVTFFILFTSTNSLQAMTEDEAIATVDTIALEIGVDAAMDNTITLEAKKLGYQIVGKLLYNIAKQTTTNTSSYKIKLFAKQLTLSNKNFIKLNKLDWIFILSDVVIEAMIFESDKANQLMVRTVYGNVKAGIQYGLATNALDKMGAGITWGETNFNAFVGSISGSLELYKEQVALNISTKASENYSAVVNLYKQYQTDYCTSAPKDKAEIKRQFMDECISTLIIDIFYADTEGKLAYHNWCSEYANQAETFDEIKLYQLFVLKGEDGHFFTDEESFDTYVENFFHISERNTVSRLWNSVNFDPDLQVSKNEVSYKFLSKAILYGYYPYDFVFDDSKGSIYNPIGKVKVNMGAYMIENSYQKVTGSTTSVNLNGADLETYMTRVQAAQYLNEAFRLDLGLSLASKERLTELAANPSMNGWSYHPLVLWGRKIAKGNTNADGTVTDFRPNDDISSFELLVMLVNAMDYKTCGQAGCSDLSVLNKQLGVQ